MRGRIRLIGAAVDGWTRKHWLAGGGAVLGWTVAISVVVLIILWGVTVVGLPQNPSSELAPLATQVASPQFKDPNDALDPKDRLALQRDLIQNAVADRVQTWTLLAQVIGASVLAIGGYFTWRSLHVTQQTLKATQDKLEVDREGQITNRFTQAIGQLGAMNDKEPNLEVRLGGIYALERIARDSPRDYWTIMEILTAYVRQNARSKELTPLAGVVSSPDAVPREQPPESEELPIRTDIQAILTVLQRRTPPRESPEPGPIDLTGADLRRADLRRASLNRARLVGANLSATNCYRANLTDANLTGADLRRADLTYANLSGARLTGANLTGTDLKLARWDGALLPPNIAEELARPAPESVSSPPSTSPAS